MNFGKNRRSSRKGGIGAKDPNKEVEKYPDRLLMYKDAPTEDITLEEFERFAVDRLKLLREVENITIRFKKGSEEYKKKMEFALKEFLPTYFVEAVNSSKFIKVDVEREELEQIEKLCIDRRKDNISHFILRLAFARSEDLRRWFLTQETDLFRYRFQLQNPEQTSNFLQLNKLNYKPISEEEKVNLLVKLKETLQSLFMNINTPEEVGSIDYYKVPFTSVLDLVRSRRVYVQKGQAFVPRKELVSIILGIYRSHLSQALAITARKLPYLEEDTRLLPMLKNLSSAYIGDSFTSKSTKNDQKLNLDDMEEAVKISYPICMRNLHEGLRRDHHLKHFGRLQLGLFIKAAGLSLEEALIFWRTEFTKKMDLDKFEKQYAYNVRHSYGKEGKRADYTPYSCMKVITSNQPGPGDFHGCPFKHSDSDMLKRRLQNYKVPNDATNEIMDLVKHQHYQIACTRYFEVTHKLPEGTMNINHPNQYFDESKKILSGGKPSISFPTNVKEESNNKEEANVKKEQPPPADVMDGDFDDDMEIL